jgi:nucleotide-binding universal stress UspA family protein
MEEAQLRQGTLYVLYVKELAVNLPGPLPTGERPRWQDDKHAAEIMYGMVDAGQKNGVGVVPLYIVSESPASTILDMAATLGVDILVVGSAHRSRLVSLLKGDVVTEVARNLPENIQLVIYG